MKSIIIKMVLVLCTFLMCIYIDTLEAAATSPFYSLLGVTSYEEDILLFYSNGNYSTKTMSYGVYNYQQTANSSTIEVHWIIRDSDIVYYLGVDDDYIWGTTGFESLYKVAYIDLFDDSLIWATIGRTGSVWSVLALPSMNVLHYNVPINPTGYIPNVHESMVEDIVYNSNIENDFYFKNLSTNYPENTNGSCGYVSMSMLLGYDDIFLRNDIVNDAGLLGYGSFINRSTSNSYFDVENFAISPGTTNALQSFLAYEIYDAAPGLLFESEIVDILDDYFLSYTGYNSSSYSLNVFNSNNQATNENGIKSMIDVGNPVILLLSSWEFLSTDELEDTTWGLFINKGHALIAYGYGISSSGDLFYRCHLGWEDIYTDVWVKADCVPIGIAISFSNTSHLCNNNAYVYKHKSSCQGIGLCHEHRNHEYYLNLVDYNSSSHRCRCPQCNDILFTESHKYSGPYIWQDYSYHIGVCDCSRISSLVHVVAGNGNQGSQYAICLLCGGLARLGILPNGFKSIDSTEGSYVTSSGVIVLFGSDLERFITEHNINE